MQGATVCPISLRNSVSWPVAWTPVVYTSLYGTWTVEAILDDSNGPCSPKASFRIEP